VLFEAASRFLSSRCRFSLAYMVTCWLFEALDWMSSKLNWSSIFWENNGRHTRLATETSSSRLLLDMFCCYSSQLSKLNWRMEMFWMSTIFLIVCLSSEITLRRGTSRVFSLQFLTTSPLEAFYYVSLIKFLDFSTELEFELQLIVLKVFKFATSIIGSIWSYLLAISCWHEFELLSFISRSPLFAGAFSASPSYSWCCSSSETLDSFSSISNLCWLGSLPRLCLSVIIWGLENWLNGSLGCFTSKNGELSRVDWKDNCRWQFGSTFRVPQLVSIILLRSADSSFRLFKLWKTVLRSIGNEFIF